MTNIFLKWVISHVQSDIDLSETALGKELKCRLEVALSHPFSRRQMNQTCFDNLIPVIHMYISVIRALGKCLRSDSPQR